MLKSHVLSIVQNVARVKNFFAMIYKHDSIFGIPISLQDCKHTNTLKLGKPKFPMAQSPEASDSFIDPTKPEHTALPWLFQTTSAWLLIPLVNLTVPPLLRQTCLSYTYWGTKNSPFSLIDQDLTEENISVIWYGIRIRENSRECHCFWKRNVVKVVRLAPVCCGWHTGRTCLHCVSEAVVDPGGGSGGLAPPCPQDFFKIMQCSGNFKEKNPILGNFLLRAVPPYGQNSTRPPYQSPGSAPEETHKPLLAPPEFSSRAVTLASKLASMASRSKKTKELIFLLVLVAVREMTL